MEQVGKYYDLRIITWMKQGKKIQVDDSHFF